MKQSNVLHVSLQAVFCRLRIQQKQREQVKKFPQIINHMKIIKFQNLYPLSLILLQTIQESEKIEDD